MHFPHALFNHFTDTVPNSFFSSYFHPKNKSSDFEKKMLLQKTFDSIVPADIIEEGLLGENESQLNF